jgi:hypothetical protein
MANSLSRELRGFNLIGGIALIYAAAVAAVLGTTGHIDLLTSFGIAKTIGVIWMSAGAFVFIVYAADLLVRRRPDRPLQVLVEDMKAHVLRADWLLARAAVVIGFGALLLFFNPFKIMIAHLRGFPLDHALVAIDRALFLGTDPWRLTHALFGVHATAFFQFAYSTWFAMMWLSLVYLLLRPELIRFRLQYLLAFILTWILVGSVAAFLLASAGPCYYERAFGDPTFAPLMTRLELLARDVEAMGLGTWGFDVQDKLWAAYAGNEGMFGGGISAMPSIHVAVATLMAIGAHSLSRRAGWLLGGFAVIIWIASIHLGWHYAVDGIVAAAMTWAIWRWSGHLVERYVLRGAAEPALAPVRALAE